MLKDGIGRPVQAEEKARGWHRDTEQTYDQEEAQCSKNYGIPFLGPGLCKKGLNAIG